jgi:hypothetical protein
MILLFHILFIVTQCICTNDFISQDKREQTAFNNQFAVAIKYENTLNSQKTKFFTTKEWQNLAVDDQKAIRNVLILKHAEIRHAPLDQLRLKIFNEFVIRINEASTHFPKTVIPSNPLFYWNLDIDKRFITAPLQGDYCHIGHPSPGYVNSISKKLPLEIPFTIVSDYSGDCITRETYTWDDNILRIRNGDFANYLPLNNVHSVCLLGIPRWSAGYRTNPENSAGFLITLKNGMQIIWNREEEKLYPVGFCEQSEPQSDAYIYCKNMHERLFWLRKPSHIFDRLTFKKFIWQTPQWWHWARFKFKAVIGTLFVCGTYWGIKGCIKTIQRLIAEEQAFCIAMEAFEKELTQHSIKIPEIILQRLFGH